MQLARNLSYTFTEFLKQDTLAQLVDQGALLSRLNADMHYKVKPNLLQHAQASIDHIDLSAHFISDMVSLGARNRAAAHKSSIIREIRRVEDEIDKEKRRKI